MDPVHMGTDAPGSTEMGPQSGPESRFGRPYALLEATSAWRDMSAFITHQPRMSALFYVLQIQFTY